MANPITPYMGVELPVPGQTGALGVEPVGKSWMELQNTGFQTMDAHDHTDGKGLPVPVLGINIDRDLPFNAFNAVGLRTVRFQAGIAQPGLATDLLCAYFYNGNFWVNDNLGNKIQVTASGGVVGTPGSITGLVAPAAVTWNSVSKIFDFTEDTNKRAGIYAGSVSIHEPVTSGKKITLKAPTGLGADYILTFPAALPASTKPLTLSAAGDLAAADSLTLSSFLAATGLGTSPGVLGNAGSSSPGVKGVGGASGSTEGAVGIGGSPNGRGVVGFGTGTGAGVRGSGSVGGSAGVEGLGGGTEPGVYGVGVIGGRFEANTAVRGAINLVPQAGASGPSNGDMWVDTADNKLKVRINGSNYSINVTAL